MVPAKKRCYAWYTQLHTFLHEQTKKKTHQDPNICALWENALRTKIWHFAVCSPLSLQAKTGHAAVDRDGNHTVMPGIHFEFVARVAVVGAKHQLFRIHQRIEFKRVFLICASQLSTDGSKDVMKSLEMQYKRENLTR